MNKSLLIIPGPVEIKLFSKNYKDFSDILALTPMAMLSLDALNIPYKVTDNYYNTDLYKSDTKRINDEAEKVFIRLDKICKDLVQFPFAYSGNISYFLQILADLIFIDKLSQALEKSYTNIYLISNVPPNNLSWDELTYSDLKTHLKSESLSINKSNGIENKIEIMRNILDIETIPGIVRNPPSILFTVSDFYQRGLNYLQRCIKNNEIPFYEILKRNNAGNPTLDKSKNNLFIIQDGYEIAHLKKYLFEYNLINPVSSLRKEIPFLPASNYDYNNVSDVLAPFLRCNFPKLNSLIDSLFKSYHREVVGRIPFFNESFAGLIDHYKPKLLLCSVGSRDVIDCLFNYKANQQNIPVIYFQHGGTTIFFNGIYQKYVETDSKIKKTLILNSWIEQKEIMHEESECIALGSISRYNLINNSSNNNNNKIIYCSGPFTFQNYRALINSVTDKQYYQISSEIIVVAKQNSIMMSIKPHPIDYKRQLYYFTSLVKIKKYNMGKIIGNISAELILDSYELIILDFMGSALLPYVFSLKVPVILYLKDMSLVNDLVLEDLSKRCYIVHNREMLNAVLRKYTKGKLPSKWSLEIIDRYVYPLENGDPGENISNYIKSIC